MILARFAAVKAIKRKLQAQGRKLANIEQRTVVSAARDYLELHPELIDEAAETVQRRPVLRKLAEREARERCANLSNAAQKSKA